MSHYVVVGEDIVIVSFRQPLGVGTFKVPLAHLKGYTLTILHFLGSIVIPLFYGILLHNQLQREAS